MKQLLNFFKKYFRELYSYLFNMTTELFAEATRPAGRYESDTVAIPTGVTQVALFVERSELKNLLTPDVAVAWIMECSYDNGVSWESLGGGGCRGGSIRVPTSMRTKSIFDAMGSRLHDVDGEMSFSGSLRWVREPENPNRLFRCHINQQQTLTTRVLLETRKVAEPTTEPTIIHHSVAFNSSPTLAGTDFSVITVTTPTFTINSASDLYAIVGIGAYSNIFSDTFTVSCSGATATAIANASIWTGAIGAKLFGADGPASGTGKTATASWSTSASYVALSVVVCDGADSTSNGASTSGSTPRSLAVTSAVGDRTVTCTMDDQGGAQPTSNKTRVTAEAGFGMDHADGAASNTHTWTSAFAVLAVVGVNVVATGGAPAIPAPKRKVVGTGVSRTR